MAEEHGGVVPEVIVRNGPDGEDSHADHGARLDADVRLHYDVVWGEGEGEGEREGSERRRQLGRRH